MIEPVLIVAFSSAAASLISGIAARMLERSKRQEISATQTAAPSPTHARPEDIALLVSALLLTKATVQVDSKTGKATISASGIPDGELIAEALRSQQALTESQAKS